MHRLPYDEGGNRLSAQTNGTITSQTPNAVKELGASTVGGSWLWQGHGNKPLYSVILFQNLREASRDTTKGI